MGRLLQSDAPWPRCFCFLLSPCRSIRDVCRLSVVGVFFVCVLLACECLLLVFGWAPIVCLRTCAHNLCTRFSTIIPIYYRVLRVADACGCCRSYRSKHCYSIIVRSPGLLIDVFSFARDVVCSPGSHFQSDECAFYSRNSSSGVLPTIPVATSLAGTFSSRFNNHAEGGARKYWISADSWEMLSVQRGCRRVRCEARGACIRLESCLVNWTAGDFEMSPVWL